jgi:hypothetical protein
MRGYGGVRWEKPTIGGNDVHASLTFGRTGEAPGVGQLAPEIQSTEKAECLTQGDPGGLEPAGQGKRRTLIEQDGGAFTSAVCW